MHTFVTGGKTVCVFPAAEADAPVVYLNTFGDEGQKVYDALKASGCPPLSLVAISGLSWEHDMAPWAGAAAFKNGAPFTGSADAYLRLLTGELLPAVEWELPGTPRWRGIAGYSLAGLFAVYALYHTDVFSRAASVSGSLWFAGFREYVFSHEPKRPPDYVYFSLGDRGAKPTTLFFRRYRRTPRRFAGFINSAVSAPPLR